jgi:hypothetical protein
MVGESMGDIVRFRSAAKLADQARLEPIAAQLLDELGTLLAMAG